MSRPPYRRELAPSARLVLRFVRKYIQQETWAPNYKEIMEATGIASTSNVGYALEQLQADGLIKHRKGQARAISITQRGMAYLEQQDVG